VKRTLLPSVVVELVAISHHSERVHREESFIPREAFMQETLILIVEPDLKLQEGWRQHFSTTAYTVIIAPDGQQALYLWQTSPTIAVALIETELPGLSGFAVCAELRKLSDVPIILITDSYHVDDIVRGFEVGADDTLPKPVSFWRLNARIVALLRRIEWLSTRQAASPMVVGDFSLDDEYHEVHLGNAAVNLTPLEYQLLRHLMQQPERPISKEELLDAVWAYLPVGDINFVRVVIRRLREKIEPNPAQPRYLLTVPGVGYRLNTAKRFAGSESYD
jgi:DNA-binding response OmpR family regulator